VAKRGGGFGRFLRGLLMAGLILGVAVPVSLVIL
jgi:hypothetical protein